MTEIHSLQIHLLGPVEIQHQGKSLKISRRAERAILYYLAAENRPISRTALIDFLWPEADQVDPRGSLRTALSRLRAELPDSEILMTELDQVTLNSDKCWVDLLEFKSKFEKLQGLFAVYPDNRPLPAQIVQQIQDALSLWNGKSFIQGENFNHYPEVDAWRRDRAIQWGHQKKLLQRRMAAHYQSSGSPQIALDILYDLAREDLLDVETQVQILNILSDLGRHQEASNYCDLLETRYEREYQAPLPNELVSRCQYFKTTLEITQSPEKPKWPSHLSMQLQMVNREKELTQLKQAFFRGGIVAIKGEAGSGKTRLVQELFQTITPTPHLLLAPGRALENTLPLSPIIHCLRKDIPTQIWHELEPVWVRELSILLPELSDIRSDCNLPDEPTHPIARQHLFDALHKLFTHLIKARGRLLFLLDDAQWVDQYTLQTLAYLISQGLFQNHALLVIAYRSDEPNLDLDVFLDRFVRTNSIQRIMLRGLRRNELADLTRQALNEPPPAKLLEKLERETNGNPFMALEIIRLLLDENQNLEEWSSREHLPLPDSIYALVRKRLSRLTPNARKLLTTAAILGDEFDYDLLIQVTKENHRTDLAAIEPLIENGFLHTVPGENPRKTHLHFTHEKVREVILRETNHIRQQSLHLRTAEILSQNPHPKSKAALIASHFLAGGDITAAFDWFLKAADYAWSLGATEETQFSYQQAEQLYHNSSKGSFSNEDIRTLYKNWCNFAYQSNQTNLLEETAQKLLQIGESNHDPALVGSALIAFANARFLKKEFEPGLRFIQNAIQNLEKTNHPKTLAQAYIRQGVFYWWMQNFDETLDSADKALTLYQSLNSNDPEVISIQFNAHHLKGMTYYAKGDANLSLHNANEIYENFASRLNPFDSIRALNLLAYANLLNGDFKTSRLYSLKGLEILKSINNSFVEIILLAILSRAEIALGYLDDAYHHACLAKKLGEEKGHPYTSIRTNCIFGDIFSLIQDYSIAQRYYRASQNEKDPLATSYQKIENDIHLARMLAWSGKTTEARNILQPSLIKAQETKMEHLQAEGSIVLGICALYEKDLLSAERAFSKANEITQKKGLRYKLLWVSIGQVHLAILRGNLEKAKSILNFLYEKNRKISSPWITLHRLALSQQLAKCTGNEKKLAEIEEKFLALIDTLSQHTQSSPLADKFKKACQHWHKGHGFI